jgi:hypothetical protein
MRLVYSISILTFLLLIAYSMYCFTKVGIQLRKKKTEINISRTNEIFSKFLLNDELVLRYLLKGIFSTIIAFMSLLPLLFM